MLAAFVALSLPARADAASPLSARYLGQDPWPVLSPGESAGYSVRFRNTGTMTWKIGSRASQVALGVAGDDRRPFALGMSEDWLSPDRVTLPAEREVHPGDIGVFTFTLRAPSTPGAYVLPLRLVVDGLQWLEDEGVYVRIAVVPDRGLHVSVLEPTGPVVVLTGRTSDEVVVKLRNTGTRTFVRDDPASSLLLGVRADDASFAGLAGEWIAATRVAMQDEAQVAPGGTATFRFHVHAGMPAGSYSIPLRPLVEGVQWLEDGGLTVDVTVRAPGSPVIVPEIVRSGLSHPWDVAFTPDGRMLVTERDAGVIHVFASGEPDARQIGFVEVGRVAEHQNGLMSLAVDPDFERTHWVFACAGALVGLDDTYYELRRYALDAGGSLKLDRYLFRREIPWHEGMHSCRIKVGPDGNLWMTLGTDTLDLGALDPASWAGKILRLTRDGGVPADNPVWPGQAGPSYVYSVGHRNPQGLAFDQVTGMTVAAEHGPERDDEINDIVGGASYGWPLFAGTKRWAGQGDAQMGPEFRAPAWSSGERTIAISGIAFATAPSWGDWQGSLFGATLAEMDLRRFTREGGRFVAHEILIDGVYGRLRSVTQAPDGALYVTTDNGGDLDHVIRIAPRILAPEASRST